MHERPSVHSVSFLGATLSELESHWRALGVKRLSLVDSQLFEPELSQVIAANGYSVETVYHLFSSSDGLSRVIEAAAGVGARAIYMLTGGTRDADLEASGRTVLRVGRPLRA